MRYDKFQKQLFYTIVIMFITTLVLSFIIPFFVPLFFLFIGTIFFIMRYFKKREEQVNNLFIYLQKLNNGEYIYELEAYEEGELSRLHSELNKTAVEMQAINNKLRNQKILLSQQFQDVSHQLKTPLAALMLLNDLQEETEITKNINNQIERMKNLIDSLVKLIKADADLLPFSPEWIVAKKIIDAVLENLDVHLKSNKIDVEIKGAFNKIYVDSKLMFEVLYNIINNKLDYAEEKIFINVVKKGPWTTIYIYDDGEAIIHENKIFDRFYTYSGKAESLGIGLAYVKSLIDLHNAKIKVEGKNTFVIELNHMTEL